MSVVAGINGAVAYPFGDVVDDVAVLHRRGPHRDVVARVVDGAEDDLHTLREEANLFVRIPPAYPFIIRSEGTEASAGEG